MTQAIDDHISDYDGNTILVGSDDSDYIFVSGFELNKFNTEDKIVDFVSLMINNTIPNAIAIWEKYTYFKFDHYKHIENNKFDKRLFLNVTNDKFEPFEHPLAKCGEGAFKTM